MVVTDALGLYLGAVALGAIHGVEPGHGWPVAASYALDRPNKWVAALTASLVLGVGHLVSSIAVVVLFFVAKSYFELAQVNDPMTAFGVEIGGPVSVVAGVLLVVLGVREYTHGHGQHGEHEHTHADSERRPGDRSEPHGHHAGSDDANVAADRGILGIAWFAFLLGFAHEEEFEIIALCAGSAHCLGLMTAYALTVIGGIVTLTLLLVAGYERFETDVERYTPYLPAFSATVLVGMGLGFVFGLV